MFFYLNVDFDDNLKKEFTIRDYTPGDEEEIVELLQLGFNGWPRFDINSSPLEH